MTVRRFAGLLLALACAAAPAARGAITITFDGKSLGSNSYWNGSDLSGGYTEGGAHFNNLYNTNYSSWSGFALSNVNDPNTPGWGNQYADRSGAGVGGSGNYAVVYDSAWEEGDIVTFSAPVTALGFFVNNTAYAALDMLDGSPFSKKFGGPSGTDPDWFLLTVAGRDAGGNPLGSIPFYLADFRSESPAGDYIVGNWTWLDLASLGPSVTSLHFALTSSDNGQLGMNTPAFFAMDSLQIVPEPATAGFLIAGAAALWLRRRWPNEK